VLVRRWLLVGGVLLTVAGVSAADPGLEATFESRSKGTTKSKGERSRPGRVYSRDFTTWIYPEPSRAGQWIGYIRVGQSVALRDSKPRPGPGCGGGFVGIEPYGWVCLDRTSTLTPRGRFFRAMQLSAPKLDPLPYRYALSNGAPMYRRLPSRDEWLARERFLGPAGTFKPLSWGNRGHERLAEVREIPATDRLPFFLEGGGSAARATPRGLVRRDIPLGSMLSYTRAVQHAGRTFLVSADGTVVPADRVRPYRESTFRGVELPGQGSLPLAWIRTAGRPKYRRTADGKLVATPWTWGLRSWIELETGIAPVEQGRETYHATRDRDRGTVLWIAESDASIVRPAEKLPWGVSERDKWVTVSIRRGTLVAYEGNRPVFTTLVSPGAGGVPVRGRDPVKWSTTPLGIYRIALKHVAADMSPERGDQRSFWIADVPWTQYFNAPFALHTAYWHEDFGQLMSAGCVNLSPRDGKRLFYWTDPQPPPGWGGVAAHSLTGKGSFVVVTR